MHFCPKMSYETLQGGGRLPHVSEQLDYALFCKMELWFLKSPISCRVLIAMQINNVHPHINRQ